MFELKHTLMYNIITFRHENQKCIDMKTFLEQMTLTFFFEKIADNESLVWFPRFILYSENRGSFHRYSTIFASI